MHPIVSQHLDALRLLCIRHHVKTLSLFGSAASGEFRPGESDLDFLVEFDDLTPPQRAKHFFTLEFELQRLLGVNVDLGEPEGMRNPRFRESVERSRIPVYAAA